MYEESGRSTSSEAYAQRLVRLQSARWKRWLDVQAVYRWNLRRLQPGFTLEIGCGIGRNLEHLRGQSVGVDTNEYCVRTATERGLIAFTPEEFAEASDYNRPARFDSLLLAHVAEHMTEDQAAALLEHYLPLLRPGGRVIAITPQEAGFRSDATHVQLMDFARLRRIAIRLGLEPERSFSVPFPRQVGHWFKYNEFVVVSRKPGPHGRAARPAF